MKSEAQIRDWLYWWLHAVPPGVLCAGDDYSLGLACGHMLALATVLEDIEAKRKAREIAGPRGGSMPVGAGP